MYSADEELEVVDLDAEGYKYAVPASGGYVGRDHFEPDDEGHVLKEWNAPRDVTADIMKCFNGVVYLVDGSKKVPYRLVACNKDVAGRGICQQLLLRPLSLEKSSEAT